ncbi:hypothetical protein K523DRAFT_358648 [Schizophyllum commune Tattone D]|nr:hypothetical protein K523DRAFT_358648 [Schizophyllum commune Tattone D]
MSYPAPLSTHAPDAQIREADFRSWAAQRVEQANQAALWAEQCEAGLIQQYGSSYPYRIEVQSSHTATCPPEAQATSPATARPRQLSRVEEEAARHSKPAASPPPRPIRSAARMRPPPIPPPSTRPQVNMRPSDACLEDRAAKAASTAATWPEPAPTPARPPTPPV